MPGKQTILVVDDRGVDRLLLRKMLEGRGYTVLEAADGEEGLEMTGFHEPDLIIADTLMPKMDGFGFLKNIKTDEKTKRVPFILYSAVYTGYDDEKLALLLGASDFIPKPIDSGEFLKRVDAAIEDVDDEKETAIAELALDEEEYLRRYSHVVAAKLEEKVRELETTNERLQRRIANELKLEEDLRETLSYLENLFNCANAPIIVWDPEFRISWLNNAFEHLVGMKTAEILNAPLDSIFPEDVREESLADICRMTAGAGTEIPILHVDGTIRTVLWCVATVYAADGTTAVAIIAQGQDVTERKNLEQELQQTLDELKESYEESSSPIIQACDGVLVLPIIGVLDSHRINRLTETMLARIADTKSKVVIIDITGARSIDSDVADRLLGTVAAARLLGTKCVITGISPTVAGIAAGWDLEGKGAGLVTRRSLQDGLRYAMKIVGDLGLRTKDQKI